VIKTLTIYDHGEEISACGRGDSWLVLGFEKVDALIGRATTLKIWQLRPACLHSPPCNSDATIQGRTRQNGDKAVNWMEQDDFYFPSMP
jgi:hypothetical protein